MHRYWRYFYLENLDTVRHVPAGRFWGVLVSVTPTIWMGLLLYFGLGLALNAPLLLNHPIEAAYRAGVLVIGVAVSTLGHALGHILGGKLVDSPMDELLFTATRGTNLYHGDQQAVPGYAHLGRALGGPALNLAIYAALAGLPPAPKGLLADVLNSIASTSLFMGAGGLLPLPSVDGQVIWREILRLAFGPRGSQAK